MRTILIGDVHGCSAALEGLLDRTAPQPGDTLVLLGDLFDRGPDSWGVFQTVQRLAETWGERFVLLRGNHEDYLLTENLPLGRLMVWNRVGRGETVKSFRAHGGRMEDSIPWLRAHCRLWWQGERLQAVHAAVRQEPVELNDRETLLHSHTATLTNSYAGRLTVVGHIALPYAKYFPGNGEETRPLQPGEWLPLPERGVICIDTGCGKGGWLTAMIADGAQFRLESVPESERRSRQ